MKDKLHKLCDVPGTDLSWWIWQYAVATNPNNGKPVLQTDYLLKREPRGMRSKVLLNADLVEVLALRGSIDDMLTVASGIPVPVVKPEPESLPVDAVVEYLRFHGAGTGFISHASAIEIMGEFDLPEAEATEVLRLARAKNTSE